MPPRFAPARPAHGRVQPNGAGTINGSGSSSASVYGVRQPHRPGTRRASTQGGDGGPLADPVPIEEFPPPEWRTVLNSRADLGTYF
jgi:mediator of RNA polymerase II transcription subunit 12